MLCCVRSVVREVGAVCDVNDGCRTCFVLKSDGGEVRTLVIAAATRFARVAAPLWTVQLLLVRTYHTSKLNFWVQAFCGVFAGDAD